MNLVSEAEMPYPLPKVAPLESESECDSGNYRSTLDRCLAEFDWSSKSGLQGKMLDGRYHGLAIGCYIESGGSGPKENARLVVEADGTISVFVGSTAVGQGLETTIAQIAADALELPIRFIRVFHGSTNYLREGFGSYGSRSIVMGGSAVWLAASKLRLAIGKVAAIRLGCDAGEIKFSDGVVTAPNGQALSLSELAGEKIAAEASFASNKRTYSYGTHAAHVSVDAKTGHVKVLEYVAVEDVGRIINPETLHGQTIGAIVQGLGGTLLEHLIYDEDGQLLTASFADYLIPTIADFPNIRAIALEECRSPNNPLGAKGGGEGGIIPVGGVIANAVASALESFGVQPCELPLSPPRVWRLIANSGLSSHRA
jgi:aerobic carbon-monoxide dehydrogenase large subunit